MQPPTMHLLVERLNPPYLGFLTCREFYRGRDGGAAVAAHPMRRYAMRWVQRPADERNQPSWMQLLAPVM